MFGMRALTAATLLLALGCSDDCHDIGCGSTLIVELAAEQGFADGSYEVTLESPQGTKVCTFDMLQGSAESLSCSPEGASLDSGELPKYLLVRYHQDSPQTLTVTVVVNGTELARADFVPEYEDVSLAPNGCAGPCTAAQVSLEL